MATDLSELAGDECMCICHRDSSVRHAVACCAQCPECSTRVRSTEVNDGHRPKHCAGFRLGRITVRVDAAVCLLAGIALIVLAVVHPIMPVAAHGAVGVISFIWGIFLSAAPGRIPLRAVLITATVVNVIALIVLLAAGLAVSWDHSVVRTLAVIAAVVVAIFTVVEALALVWTTAD